MNFTKTIIEAIKHWVNGKLDVVKNEVDNIKDCLDSEAVVEELFALDMIPVIVNDEGAIMTDESGNILLV